MTVATVQERFRLIAIWSWGLMAFCLPFSTALTLIFSAFGVLFGLVGFDWASLKIVIRHPIAILCVALFAWLALSMLWSIAPRDEMIEGISKYRKLLYVPLVAMLLVSTRVKPWFLMNFFVAGCLLVCIGSLFSSSGLASLLLGPQLPVGGWYIGGTVENYWFYMGPPERPTFGRAHIAQGAFLAMSILYLIGWLVQRSLAQDRNTNYPALWIASVSAFLLLGYVILSLGSLTGYILGLIGAVFWLYQLYRLKRRLAVVVGLCIVIIFFSLAPSLVKSTNHRLAKFGPDISAYFESQAQTSEGLRIRFWSAGIRYAMERPIVGSGVGSFGELYAGDLSEPENLRQSRPQPHSEYVILLVQGGAVALALFVGCFLYVFYPSNLVDSNNEKKLKIYDRSLRVVATSFLFGGLFNSIVWDAGEGHFIPIVFSSVMAITLLGSSKKRPN